MKIFSIETILNDLNTLEILIYYYQSSLLK